MKNPDLAGIRVLEAIYALTGSDDYPASCREISLITRIPPEIVSDRCTGDLKPFLKSGESPQYRLNIAGSYLVGQYFLDQPELYDFQLQYTRKPPPGRISAAHSGANPCDRTLLQNQTRAYHWWWIVNAPNAAVALQLLQVHWKTLDLPDLTDLSHWEEPTQSCWSVDLPTARVDLVRSSFDRQFYQITASVKERFLRRQSRR
ncbi:MAG: hypothetical protein OXN17_17070 [Candidatus Poribacteria bacterium]|nr:hypothetical protein [Candidatus Poribacteria bacterium]MDE0503610.1 hypothetical protein [Candidatus Poribacteria bacterium]